MQHQIDDNRVSARTPRAGDAPVRMHVSSDINSLAYVLAKQSSPMRSGPRFTQIIVALEDQQASIQIPTARPGFSVQQLLASAVLAGAFAIKLVSRSLACGLCQRIMTQFSSKNMNAAVTTINEDTPLYFNAAIVTADGSTRLEFATIDLMIWRLGNPRFRSTSLQYKP